MESVNRRGFLKALGATAAAVPAYFGTRYQEHSSNVQAIKDKSDPNFDPSKADPEIKDRLSQNLTPQSVIGATFAGGVGAQMVDTAIALKNRTSRSPKFHRRDFLERLSRATGAAAIIGPTAGYLTTKDLSYYLRNYFRKNQVKPELQDVSKAKEEQSTKPKDILDANFWRDGDFAKNSAIAGFGAGYVQNKLDNRVNEKLAEDSKNSYDATINDVRNSLMETGEVQINPWQCFPDHRLELKELLPHELRNRFMPLRLTLTTWEDSKNIQEIHYPRTGGTSQQLAYFSGSRNDDKENWSGPGVYPVDDAGKRINTEKEVLVPLQEFRLVITE